MQLLNIYKKIPYKSFIYFATLSTMGYNIQTFKFQKRSHCDEINTNTKKTEENIVSRFLCHAPSSTLHNTKYKEIMQDVKQRAEEGEWIPFLYPIYFEFWTLITLMEIMKKNDTNQTKEEK